MHLSKLALCTALATATASAQEAGSIGLGGFDLIPTVTTSLSYDDNVTRSIANSTDSFVSIIAPELMLLNNFGANQLQVGYSLKRGDYFSTSEDDYTDHFLSASLGMELNSRNRFNTSVLFEAGHEARGTGFSLGGGDALTSVDKYKQKDFNFVYSYGALSANARIDVNLAVQDMDYDSKFIAVVNAAGVTEQVDNYRSRDRTSETIGTSFYYNLASATDLVVDLVHKNLDYDVARDPLNPLDSAESSVLVGVKWESTAATTGYAKVGIKRKDFDVETRDNFTGNIWQAGVTWQPYDRSTFNLVTNSDTRETNAEGNFIVAETIAVDWQHQWMERLSTTASVAYGTDTYDAQSNERKDKTSDFSLVAAYQFTRWMTVQAGYKFEKLTSNRQSIGYNRTLFSITARITL